ncbi:MAG TPA: class I SAM-dependent methyltransferase [Tepidisphaeraceae bacterium]|nr:class I SAM-dependent methyltransferase [Tepidisphaeraceae bacterium]
MGKGKHSTPRRTDWGEVAEWYDQLVGEAGSEYHRQVVLPGVLRLLSPRAGERIVDIGCGQGVLCRLLAERGVEVTGIDAAEELIRVARQRGPQSIRYHVADARKLDFLPAAHFDAATCVLAIQNIHPLGPVLAGVSRALREGGRLVMVMMHPCFRSPRETSWGWDQAAKVQFRRVDRYLTPRKSPIVMHPGADPGRYTWTFHRPIQSYVKALRHAGMVIDAMQEWPSHKHSSSGPRAQAENLARREIPMFLAIRAFRLPAAVWQQLSPDAAPADASRCADSHEAD